MRTVLEIVAAQVVKTVAASATRHVLTAAAGQLRDLLRRKLGRLPSDRDALEKAILQHADRDPEFAAELSEQLVALGAGGGPAVSPPPPDPFADRDEVRARIGQSTGVWLIAGQYGVGKTALAWRIAHDAAERFPGGQVYVDLDDWRQGEALRTAEVQRYVLGQLGVGEVEDAEPQLSQQYLSALVRRRFVLVLENALSEAEARPHAQPWPHSLVLVTTRKLTDELRIWCAGDRLVELHGLDWDGSWQLLASRCGEEPLASEPAAARELLARCDRMPFAVLLVSSLLQRRRGEPGAVAAVLAELRDAAVAEDVIQRCLTRSVGQLAPDAVDDLLALAGQVGEDFTYLGAAATLGHPVRSTVDELIDACLLERKGGRLRLHQLVREYARRLARDRGLDGSRYVDRQLRSYRDLAVAADLQHGKNRLRCYPEPKVQPWPWPDLDPVDWLAAESGTLVELVGWASWHGRDAEAVQLCGALELVLRDRGYHWRCADAFQWGVRSAEVIGEPKLRARLHAMLGRVFTLMHMFDRAAAELDTAAELATGVDHPRLESSILEFRARLAEELAEHRPVPNFSTAVALLRRAVEIDERAGLGRPLWLHRRMLGNVLVKAGEPEQARRLVVQNPDWRGEPRNGGRDQMVLAKAYTALGELPAARAALAEARVLIGQSGATQYELELADIESEIALRAGDPETARALWGWVTDRYEEWGHPKFDIYLAKLDRLPPPPR